MKERLQILYKILSLVVAVFINLNLEMLLFTESSSIHLHLTGKR